ncbi:hypothetical protein [Streptomyces sp. NPDC002054]|uniref:hypothetical protein n=1 Tax=Streptomyces sp. NPDC002054 TaxID=3154663 RepID=UPI00331A4501
MTAQQPEAAEPAPAQETAPEATLGPAAPARSARRRRLAFGVLRWTAALLVFAGAGTAVTYEITGRERTDVPGLATEPDGRWDYPEIRKPELPKGAPLPFAADNRDGVHYAALTGLLLPAPAGARPDDGLKPGQDGTVTPDSFLAEYVPDSRPGLKEQLRDEGLRQIAVRGWTTPDGTRTRIYLLRFHTSAFTDAFSGCTSHLAPVGGAALADDDTWSAAKREEGRTRGYDTQSVDVDNHVTVMREAPPAGDEAVRLACIQSGDLQAVVLQTRKGAEPAAVPFHQTVILQNQLLG